MSVVYSTRTDGNVHIFIIIIFVGVCMFNSLK